MSALLKPWVPPERPSAVRDPHAVTRAFEAALCSYTGAPFAVATNSCTMALLLAVAWAVKNTKHIGYQGEYGRYNLYDVAYPDGMVRREPRPLFEIPRRTYVSVPCSIIHAGGRVAFRDEEWEGSYQLKPYRIWDSARWFTSDLFRAVTGGGGGMVCTSFHFAKTLGDSQGGAILHGDPEADRWLRRARFDGRTEHVAPKDDAFDFAGWHCYLSPDVSARLLTKLSVLPLHNAPLPNSDYPDLSTFEVFR